MEVAIVKVCFKLKKDGVRKSLTEHIVVLTPKRSYKKVQTISIQKVEEMKNGLIKKFPGLDVSCAFSIKFVKPLCIIGLDEKGKEVL